MDDMSGYTEEDAKSAIDFAERQLKRALGEFLMFRDLYNGVQHQEKFDRIAQVNGALSGAMVAVRELYTWTKPTP